jgi:hypothetical protein
MDIGQRSRKIEIRKFGFEAGWFQGLQAFPYWAK